MVSNRRTFLASASAAIGSPLLVPAGHAQGGGAPIRVGYVPVIGASPLYVMTGAGWTREAGIELALTKFESGPPAIQALASGTLDVLFVGIAPVAVARSKGLPVKVVAACGIGGSGFAAQGPLAASFDAAGGRVKEAFAGFRAKAGRPAKLATLPPGGTPTVALRYWLRSNDVAAEDVAIVAMGIDAVQGAMLTGAVDGGTALEPSLTLIRDRNPAIRTIAYATQMFPNLPGVVMAATDTLMSARPETVETLVRLAIRARDLILSDPDRAAPHVAAILSGGLVDISVFARALRSPAITFVIDPGQIVDATRASLAFEAEIGDFPFAPPVEGLFDTTVYARASAAR